MKLAIHIFSIYMIALAFIPCGDTGGGLVQLADYLLETEHLEHSDHTQHSNDCGDDFCSPFCVCTCCASVLDAPTNFPFQIKAILPIPETKPSFVSNLIPAAVYSAVWRPPAIS